MNLVLAGRGDKPKTCCGVSTETARTAPMVDRAGRQPDLDARPTQGCVGHPRRNSPAAGVAADSRGAHAVEACVDAVAARVNLPPKRPGRQ